MSNNTIDTSHFQSWKIRALMSGLGFTCTSNDVQTFSTGSPVECIYEGWHPANTKPVDWQENVPEYLVGYSFGHNRVIVWSSSPHDSGQLYYPVALGLLDEFLQDCDAKTLPQWLEYNRVDIR